MDPVAAGQPSDSSCVALENNSPDQAPVTPASHPSGVNGFKESPPTNHGSLDHFSFTGKKSPTMSPPQIHGMTPSWPEQSTQLATTTQDSIPLYPPSHHDPLDGVPYPSPEDTNSSIGSLSTFNFTPTSVSQPTSFLRQSMEAEHGDSDRETLSDRLPKRARLDPPYSTDPFGFYGRTGPQAGGSGEGTHPLTPSIPLLPSTEPDIQKSSPAATTPAGEFFAKLVDEQLAPNTSPDDPGTSAIDGQLMQSESTKESVGAASSKRKWEAYLDSVEDNYGLDCGRPDLDLNRNDDHSAIDVNPALDLMNSSRMAGCSEAANSKGSAKRNGAEYAYYAFPVPINIARHLSPLPPSLLENPINLMYFHHYLNHTARMLVPHDCENNPFITVMPSSKYDGDFSGFLLT